MAAMKQRAALVLAIVVYVTLDFSLAAMPGAFVFEPADSVETVQGRTRVDRADVMASLSPVTSAFALPPRETEDLNRPRPEGRAASTPRPLIGHLLQKTLGPTPPTEDPH